jgi:hypothetical protein
MKLSRDKRTQTSHLSTLRVALNRRSESGQNAEGAPASHRKVRAGAPSGKLLTLGALSGDQFEVGSPFVPTLEVTCFIQDTSRLHVHNVLAHKIRLEFGAEKVDGRKYISDCLKTLTKGDRDFARTKHLSAGPSCS